MGENLSDTVYGVPKEVAKDRLAKKVKEFEDPEDAAWGWIEYRSLALARLELGEPPVPEYLEGKLEVDDVRKVIRGEYSDE
ncbi:hypothetical protein [Natronorubrum daqingense]|nr:hypothetical protein [Natronorubrum daqingense]